MNQYEELSRNKLRAMLIAKRSLMGEIHLICEDVAPFGIDCMPADKKIDQMEDALNLILRLSHLEM